MLIVLISTARGHDVNTSLCHAQVRRISFISFHFISLNHSLTVSLSMFRELMILKRNGYGKRNPSCYCKYKFHCSTLADVVFILEPLKASIILQKGYPFLRWKCFNFPKCYYQLYGKGIEQLSNLQM